MQANPKSLTSTPESKRALILFAKPPVPGRVKTRLTELLSDEEAARLYEAFLRDALDRYSTLEADLRLYVSPPFEAWPDSLRSDGFLLCRQGGEGLGQRMKHAFQQTIEAGYRYVVITGTDHPTLPLSYLHQAFQALREKSSLCIGPSDDGGYYLLGMTAMHPQLFEDMSYSHPEVFEEALQKASAARARLTVLPLWYDIDAPAELHRLIAELEDPRLSLTVQSPHTRTVVSELKQAHAVLAASPC